MHDVFISHATEDKQAIARPLALLLAEQGLSVWFDEFSLAPGDSLTESIDAGLASSRYGVVILSPRFFKKPWPRKELRALNTRAVAEDRKLLIPVWHEVDHEGVLSFSAALADLVGIPASLGLEQVAQRILAVVKATGTEPTDHQGFPKSALDKPGCDQPVPPIPEQEFWVSGTRVDGRPYVGRARFEVSGADLAQLTQIASIEGETHILHGRLEGRVLKMAGAGFRAEYVLHEDGSLVGQWGGEGAEILDCQETLKPTTAENINSQGAKGASPRQQEEE